MFKNRAKMFGSRYLSIRLLTMCRNGTQINILLLLMMMMMTTASNANQEFNYLHGRLSRSPRDTYYGSNYGSNPSSQSSFNTLHKPEFPDCNNYQPRVSEGQPVGEHVITVSAVDRDPEDNGGKIRYSTASKDKEGDLFHVHPETGEITTRKIFDRDEPEREKVAYFTVRAIDNGTPELTSICTLKVEIMDTNDNKPMFDKFEYKESIPADMAVGRVVMRISATDIDDGENGTVEYRFDHHYNHPDYGFFSIDKTNGEIKLEKPVTDKIGHSFSLSAVAYDKGIIRHETPTEISIDVVKPKLEPPTFQPHPSSINVKEYSVDKMKPLLVLTAIPSGEDNLVFYEIVNGQTEATNKDSMFTIESTSNSTQLKLENRLDYESVTEYTLTIRATDKYGLAAETVITVHVEDENDEKPYFQETGSGSVLENQPIGTPVMKVRAIDPDGTSPNNVVTYRLKAEDTKYFRIDRVTGEITTLQEFDREEKDVYQVTVFAEDGAPAAGSTSGKHNIRPTTLKIEIADMNDNSPYFVKDSYEAEIAEDANVNMKVLEVKAEDKDTASPIRYAITVGNVDNVFGITSTSKSGDVYVAKQLDYEKVKNYTLTIQASDGIVNTTTSVSIVVRNVNDEPPVLVQDAKNITFKEELIPRHCISTVSARDPDIEDRKAPQHIKFSLTDKEDHFKIDGRGCITVIKALDRDPGTGGQSVLQLVIQAQDEDGKGLKSFIPLTINLLDINDNAPYLASQNPVVWMENQAKGRITQMEADDYDTDIHSGPFKFKLSPQAPREISSSFSVSSDGVLHALKDNFDREFKKEYKLPIAITDVGGNEGISILTVIIGDENDNPMEYGESSIFVYKYKETSNFVIGRVYVSDPDDWDLPDKTFNWKNNVHPHFEVDKAGTISMKHAAPEGQYTLHFKVYDRKFDNSVDAVVNVTVKQITDEAVLSSGSFRFRGVTQEQFIAPEPKFQGLSKKDMLQREIANAFDVPVENVDIFTVNVAYEYNPEEPEIDVRYSVHNSPYYRPEKLDGTMSSLKDKLERSLGMEITMVRVDECLRERHHCDSSCTSELKVYDNSLQVFTNQTSFVGVNATVVPVCTCLSDLPTNCEPNPCFNQGTCHSGGDLKSFQCECAKGFDGPRCEKTSIALDGQGYAWYPPLSACSKSSLEIQFKAYDTNSLLFYNGPTYSTAEVSDFISLELQNGKPRLLMSYGTGVVAVTIPKASRLDNYETQKISIDWSERDISMRINNCLGTDESCYGSVQPVGVNTQLNVNGPFQLGGLSFEPAEFRQRMNWNEIPITAPFRGCIENMTFQGEGRSPQYFNLGQPSYATFNVTSCDAPLALTAKLGVDVNFIVILLVCILILILLIVAIVVYRRRRNYEHVKGAFDDGVRENIVNYSEEGGEGDQTAYDLSILQKPANGYHHDNLHHLGRENGEGPDIKSFLQGNKDKVDQDPDGLPYDDVRNYAYEGDGNSMGSLSSLASGTDDEDLNFDYLPNFGPRFKKLADMYSGQSSDDESFGPPPPSREAWC